MRLARSIAVLWALVASVVAGAEDDAPPPLTLATAGRARATIVLAHDAIPAERTAARELADYLKKVSGATFEVVDEGRRAKGKDRGAEIHVGPTDAARRLASCTSRDPEQWTIRTEPERLFLCGGRPRGTLYAVYHLLEDHLGVRWWTPWEESVPFRADLVLPPIVTSGKPAFGYRDVFLAAYGPAPQLFAARSRLNGEFSFVGEAYGGRIGYGPPHHVHTFYMYAPPDELRDEHPEYFTGLDDEDDDRGQLCLTDPGLRDWLERKLRSYIETSRADARARGESPPSIFELSHNDWAGACDCESCLPFVAREGESGALVDTVNDLSQRIANDYPDIRIGALAYWETIDPPRSLAAGPRVVVRLAELFEQDFTRPVTDPANRFYKDAINGWLARSEHLLIWEYTTTFSHGFGLPLANLPLIAQNFRYYRDHGVDGVYAQHDHQILGDGRDLGSWVIARLLEDPDRDPRALIEQFTEGYYGPAGRHVRGYLERLELAMARKPSRIGYPNEIEDWRYLDRAFLIDAQEIFDRAERAVEGDAALLKRVRFARLPVDRATLLRWPFELGDREARPNGLDPVAIANRLRQTAFAEIHTRLSNGDVKYQSELLELHLGNVMERIPPPQR